MENKHSPSKKKLISIEEEKLIRQVDYDSIAGVSSRCPGKNLLLDLEIWKSSSPPAPPSSQRVLVSIKPRAPAIKTIYIKDKSRFYSKKSSEKFASRSRSRLGIGDHPSINSSFVTNYSENAVIQAASRHSRHTDKEEPKVTAPSTVESNISSSIDLASVRSPICLKSKTETHHEEQRANVYNDKKRPAEKCYIYTQPQFIMNIPKPEAKTDKNKGSKATPNKVDIGTFIVTNSPSDVIETAEDSKLKKLYKKIAYLEHRVMKQEMVFRSIDPNLNLSSSDEECKEPKMRLNSGSGRPCCSYIQQYSHIPETSAFQRYAQQASPLSPSKATTLDKEHNSEQYGRDFTTYDGITARGRRLSASVPCKRDDVPKMAAERVHKIRHKLNPVRDYRLMDTVHYLAQGEFAPRDDGIKLTPSREAVLSDIIWEDVCRTHWPNARLGRRLAQPEQRCGTRCELQRLIDSLLRERVAHVERRRRRHYRIVKLNHRHENCRPVGKTGDIIVASHKKKNDNEDRDLPINDYSALSATLSDRRRDERTLRKSHRSHDRLYQDSRQKRNFRETDCLPGPSYAARGSLSREPTCCYRSTSPTKKPVAARPQQPAGMDLTSVSSMMSKRNPRLLIKKEVSRSKRYKEEPNLEQYILLPTLVIRTPSNMKRQKKFNELYHRILNVQMNKDRDGCEVATEAAERNPNPSGNKMKDIGFNINITLSASDDDFKNSRRIDAPTPSPRL